MQSIPRIILCHAATLENRTGTDADGVGTYNTAVNLAFIRCEPVKAWSRSNIGEMKDDKLTLFYDCVNSEPVGVEFNPGDMVTFDGTAYTVRVCEVYHGEGAEPHHFEVKLK